MTIDHMTRQGLLYRVNVFLAESDEAKIVGAICRDEPYLQIHPKGTSKTEVDIFFCKRDVPGLLAALRVFEEHARQSESPEVKP
jgi:hypothetical protein